MNQNPENLDFDELLAEFKYCPEVCTILRNFRTSLENTDRLFAINFRLKGCMNNTFKICPFCDHVVHCRVWPGKVAYEIYDIRLGHN
jgi:hypothetical protein